MFPGNRAEDTSNSSLSEEGSMLWYRKHFFFQLASLPSGLHAFCVGISILAHFCDVPLAKVMCYINVPIIKKKADSGIVI